MIILLGFRSRCTTPSRQTCDIVVTTLLSRRRMSSSERNLLLHSESSCPGIRCSIDTHSRFVLSEMKSNRSGMPEYERRKDSWPLVSLAQAKYLTCIYNT